MSIENNEEKFDERDYYLIQYKVFGKYRPIGYRFSIAVRKHCDFIPIGGVGWYPIAGWKIRTMKLIVTPQLP
jgi:hypothetical protein